MENSEMVPEGAYQNKVGLWDLAIIWGLVIMDWISALPWPKLAAGAAFLYTCLRGVHLLKNWRK